MYYVSYGLEIDPDEQITPIMTVTGSSSDRIKFELESYFGSFESNEFDESLIVSRQTAGKFKISSAEAVSLTEANKVLASLIYGVRIYDARPMTDFVTLIITGDIEATVTFPIRIVRKAMPILVYREDNKIESRITIVTKTFMRYFKPIINSMSEISTQVAISSLLSFDIKLF